MIHALLPLALPLTFAFGQEKELAPLEVQSSTIRSTKEKSSTFDQSRLAQSNKLHLDQILLENPAFGAYRRSHSSIAHPTSQGVSLRGAGTSAASRSIILLDGIPLNDPFGGWVRWNRFSLGELESVRFGQASTFASSAGAIELTSRRPANHAIRELRLAAGDVHGFSADGFSATTANKEGWDATASFRVEDFIGHPVIRASQRGAIDEDAWSRMRAARATISHQLTSGRLVATLAGFDEKRGNGTPLGRNQGDGFDWSLGLQNEYSRTILFGKEREFASVFPTVKDPKVDRSEESVALDQYAVPAKSLGFGHLRSWDTPANDFSLSLSGLHREGHTHEDAYGKRRIAGGRQTEFGLSFTNTWSSAENWTFVANLRGDWFHDDQGMRKRWQLSDDTVLENESFAARENFEMGGSLQLGKRLSQQLAARASVRSHVRRPTLNELYRPYRVGDFSVAPNESLSAERITGLEFGLDWQASDHLTTSLTLFRDRLHESVANVSSPTDPDDAKRSNLDLARAQGIEVAFDHRFAENLRLGLSTLLMDTEVRTCPENPGINGNRFAQAPEHRTTASLLWTPPSWTARLDARHESNRFDDVRNSRLLDDSLTFDFSLAQRISENSRLSISVQNLADAETQTSLSSDGIITTGAPRNFLLELAWEF